MSDAGHVNVLVVGSGVMGGNHARVLSDLPAARLVAIADTNAATAKRISDKYHCRMHTDWREAIQQPDVEAVIVAVPTVRHAEVAMVALAAGRHVLVEKPIAPTVADGEAMAALAGRVGRRLMIGHEERFNPAVMALRAQLAAGALGRIFHVEARRQGPFPGRILDVGVAVDLAVHDVDVLRHVTGAEFTSVSAATARRIAAAHEDTLYATAFLGDGILASVAINWLTPTKIRSLTVVGERGMFQVDYLTQDLTFFENAAAGPGQWDTLSLLRGVGEGRMIRHVVPKQEPLRNELTEFLAAIREEREPAITAADGIRAVEVVQALVHSSAIGARVEFRPAAVAEAA
jgi:predicted dehydrogenase